jgi:hypothetical protein
MKLHYSSFFKSTISIPEETVAINIYGGNNKLLKTERVNSAPLAKTITRGYNNAQKGQKPMKNKLIATILILGIWVPFLLITVEEISDHTISFGFTETSLVVAGVCIFAALPLASIQLLRK